MNDPISVLPRPGGFTPFPRSHVETSLPERFRRVARDQATRPALVGETAELDYAALDSLTDRIATAALARGVAPHEPIAVVGSIEPPTVAAILGALKAGATAVPLDPAFPAARNAQITASSGATVALVTPAAQAAAAALGFSRDCTIEVDVRKLPPAGADLLALVSLGPRDPACLIYTSGSTGRPKGVLLTHGSLLHVCMRRTNVLEQRAGDRFSLLFSCSVHGACNDIFGALLNGASLHPFNLRADGFGDLLDWVAREKITVFHSVASAFRKLASIAGARRALPDLRLIVLGGETAIPSDVEAGTSLLPPGGRVASGLGTTETGMVRCALFAQGDPPPRQAVPLGRAVDEVEVRLEDPDGKPVPEGGVGEIVVSAPYLSAGYWRDPEATARVFSDDPLHPGWRRYRTGDLGCLDDDGVLWHRGRGDRQVKVRGYRVETAEVEDAILRHLSVGEAAVIAAGPVEQPSLVAFVVARSGGIDTAALRAHCVERLPANMVPARFVSLEALPRTVNGKIDRQLLGQRAAEAPAPAAPPAGAGAASGPADPTLARLIELWRLALPGQPVDADTDFHQEGGDSLGAMAIMVGVEQLTGRRYPLRAMTFAPTPGRMADLLRGDERQAFESGVVALRRAGHGEPLFLVPPWDGCVYLYGRLARELRTPRPVFGLEPRTGPDQHVLAKSIDALAAFYAGEIVRQQPAGPVLLFGYSAGAVIAWALAAALRRAGRTIGFLGIGDDWCPVEHEELGETFAHRLRRRLVSVRRLGALRTARFMRDHFVFTRRFREATADESDYARWVRAVLERKSAALAGYVAPAQDLAVTVFRASTQLHLRALVDETLGWRHVARRGVVSIEVSGDHHSLCGDDVVALARALDARLAALEAANDGNGAHAARIGAGGATGALR